MNTISQVDILENWYQIVDWYIEPQKDPYTVHSDIQRFEGMNELKDYRDSGVYYTAGVPFQISQISPEKYAEEEAYLAFARAYSDAVFSSLKKGHVFLAAGSYCTHVPSILGGIRRFAGEEARIGVVWLDAHADNHIAENTSETKLRLLGVPMAVFTGQTMKLWRQKVGLIPPIFGKDVLASDIRYRDMETNRNLTSAGVKTVIQDDFQNREKWTNAVQDLAEQVDMLFLHVDADILHHAYVPAYEYNVVNGNPVEIVRRNIQAVMETGKVIGVSVMCVGFRNQSDRLRDVNNMNGIRLVSSVLSSWKYRP